MLTASSPISEIALEAKDTSDDVKQVAMAIEASCKHVDNTVTTIPLSGVSEFIDNFPIGKPEITPGYVGYANDKNGSEYDVSNISNIVIEGNPMFGPRISFPTTVDPAPTSVICLKNEYIVFFSYHESISLYDSNVNLITTVNLGSNFSTCNLVEINNTEYLSLFDYSIKAFRFMNTDDLSWVDGFDLPYKYSISGSHEKHFYYNNRYYIVRYENPNTYLYIYDFSSKELLHTQTIDNKRANMSADDDFYYVFYARQVYKYNHDFTLHSEMYYNASVITQNVFSGAESYGDKKLLYIADSIAYLIDLDSLNVVKSFSVTNASNLNFYPSGDYMFFTKSGTGYRVDSDGNITASQSIYSNNDKNDYSYPYLVLYAYPYIYKIKDNSIFKLIAKAKKRGVI